jgi:hypothetical protein
MPLPKPSNLCLARLFQSLFLLCGHKEAVNETLGQSQLASRFIFFLMFSRNFPQKAIVAGKSM